jgi:hypothetical protein
MINGGNIVICGTLFTPDDGGNSHYDVSVGRRLVMICRA